MPPPGYRQFIPSIPESDFDRVALSLLETLPPGMPAITVFGRSDCSAGAALVEPIECCWDFGCGATRIIERLSLGASNVWLANWLCEPGVEPENMENPEGARVVDSLEPPARRPWVVRHHEVGLSVFPTGFDAILHGESAVTRIPAGTPVGRISFSPNGLRTFDPDNRSYAVAHAFAGFELMFGCMNEAATRQLSMPEYFLGDAEKRMCEFLRHFDFDVIDNGELGATAFAPVERVRARLLKNRQRGERLLERAHRESARHS